jgi:hypothetical protein
MCFPFIFEGKKIRRAKKKIRRIFNKIKEKKKNQIKKFFFFKDT